jgi:K+-sensing histidine kinase KdpD
VVIPLDTAAEAGTAIETAARLAARANAPLHGIFVEDEDLLNLANLPFARQVTLGAGTEPLTVERVELQLRAAAERARLAIAGAAERHTVACSFEGVRGSLQSALSGVSEDDLVVASALSRPIAGQFRLEGRWWPSINTAPGPLLMTRRAWETGGAVLMMVRDQSQGSVRLLKAAARIAEARETNLILVCGADLAGAKEIEGWAM